MTPDEYEALAAKYLTALARRDMAIWARHQARIETESSIPTREVAGRYDRMVRRLIPITGTMTACERTDALRARAQRGGKPHYGEGADVVRELLAAGPVRVGDLTKAARGRGLTVNQLRRGRETVGAVCSGSGNRTMWRLPEHESA